MARLGQFAALGDALGHATGIGHDRHHAVKELVQLGIIHTQAYDSRNLFFDQGLDLAVVVALVDTAQDEHARLVHTLERIPAGIDIGGLAVVDVAHAIDRVDILQAVGHSLKVGQRLADDVLADVEHLGRQASCHRVVNIVQALERQLLTRNLPAVAANVEVEHTLAHPCRVAVIVIGRETQQL